MQTLVIILSVVIAYLFLVITLAWAMRLKGVRERQSFSKVGLSCVACSAERCKPRTTNRLLKSSALLFLGWNRQGSKMHINKSGCACSTGLEGGFQVGQ
jgi:hypothetical protein